MANENKHTADTNATPRLLACLPPGIPAPPESYADALVEKIIVFLPSRELRFLDNYCHDLRDLSGSAIQRLNAIIKATPGAARYSVAYVRSEGKWWSEPLPLEADHPPWPWPQTRFLSIPEALALGWTQTGYARRAQCVSCPTCETLIDAVPSDGSKRCHGCDWVPGEYPSTPAELEEFQRALLRRFGTTRPPWTVSNVHELRFYLMGKSIAQPLAVTIVCKPAAYQILEQFVEVGLYGPSVSAVAEELLRMKLREESVAWRRMR